MSSNACFRLFGFSGSKNIAATPFPSLYNDSTRIIGGLAVAVVLNLCYKD
jgi:hypothetical protein